MNSISLRTLILSAIVPVGVLVAVLVVQDQRQSWPFSRHVQAPQAPKTTAVAGNTLPSSATARKAIELPANQIETLGVQFESVELRAINEPVRAVATVVVDESRVAHVHTRVAGWLEALYVNTTGQQVRAGQALGGVFSQELYASQSEYLSAWRRAATGPASVVLEASRTRLILLGMSATEIDGIEKTGTVRRLVTITAPQSGVVLNRGVTEGTAVDPSTEILTLADLSQVWVIAEVAEADATRVGTGTVATLTFPTSRREPIKARVDFVYPTLTEGTRTVRVRLSVPNVGGTLRPGMYGRAEFPGASRDGLTVKRDAVVDTGQSKHVFVQTSQNVFEPRTITVGAQLADRVEILQGLAAGERVVTSGVFLIDSESRLRASAGSGHSAHGGGTPPKKTGDTGPVAAPAKHEDHKQ
jgi:Cu(I)/Ag(I) efflux system membrane fusion protein